MHTKELGDINVCQKAVYLGLPVYWKFNPSIYLYYVDNIL